MSNFNKDNGPAFAPPLQNILERYKMAMVDRLNAVKALTSITLALAPEELFDEGGEIRLNAYFGEKLDAYRAADGHAEPIGEEIIQFVWAAAQGDHKVRGRLTDEGL